MATSKKSARAEPAGSLTGAEREPLDVTAIPAHLLVAAIDAVIGADAFLSISAYDHGRTVRVALQLGGNRFDEYARDIQHLYALIEAVTAKCLYEEKMSTPSGR